jgi:hypothetical protein
VKAWKFGCTGHGLVLSDDDDALCVDMNCTSSGLAVIKADLILIGNKCMCCSADGILNEKRDVKGICGNVLFERLRCLRNTCSAYFTLFTRRAQCGGCTGKPLHMRSIRATSVPYISKPHISKLETNGKICNSSMVSWNVLPKT